MKKSDMCILAGRNLSRSKGRTILTILGVVIGCCAIIITVSLGIAMSQNQRKMLEQMGDLTEITIYNYGSVSSDGRKLKLTQRELDQISQMPDVDAVSPLKTSSQFDFKVTSQKKKKYEIPSLSFKAMDVSLLSALKYELTQGAPPPVVKRIGKTIPVLVGEEFAYEFQDKTKKNHNMVSAYDTGFAYSGDMLPGGTGQGGSDAGRRKPPYIDIKKNRLYLTVSSTDKNGKEKIYRKELQIVGTLKANMNKGYETQAGIIMDIRALEDFERAAARALSAKQERNQGYTQAVVKVNDIKNVEEVQKAIKAMGFECSSMEEIRQSMEKEVRQRQKTFGGLGAISLLVAAMGIANTMLMSVNERKKEIGVMKVLGCEIKDILTMFLLEAGIIGLLGGVCGVGISYIISFIMNTMGSGGEEMGMEMIEGGRLAVSVIPAWLVVFALLFALGVGLLSGAYPSRKAVKISALEAMKSD
ncbi:ABC transporter permease [Anaerolentibacter hominis]|uniref:ABC transporter permease n=1 Tax=Anaerolentibacter hominis TaxID=3079009 RepID=UPI0031B85DB9